MKRILFIIFLLTTTKGYSQTNISNNSTIPVAVTDAFLKRFPNSTDVSWGDNYSKSAAPANTVYFVTFHTTMSDMFNEAWLDKDGNMLKHRKAIEVSALPGEVKRSVTQKFPGHTTISAERWEENHQASYMLVIKGKDKEKTVIMDSKGAVKEDIASVEGEFVK